MNDHNYLNIDRIAFIGRTFEEYISIFELDYDILKSGPVLDCPAGSASFTAEANKLGYNVTACDALFNLSVDTLLDKGKKDIEHIYEKLKHALHLYKWKYYSNMNELITIREKALKLFADDYDVGYEETRYIFAELPRLPFNDKAFSLVLSSHFLFLYSDWLDLDFHKACLKELMRVSSHEVRIFPLVGLDAKPYSYLGDIMSFLQSEDIKVEIANVSFEFQIGGNQMMKLSRK